MIICIGEILFDLFPDERRIGGAPFNFAFHLKKLGIEVQFVSRIGLDNWGDEILEFLTRHKFDTTNIQRDKQYDTGKVKIFMNPDKTHRFSISKNSAWDNLTFDENISELLKYPPKLIYFGSLIQRSVTGRRFIQKILTEKSNQTQVFCDINLRKNSYSFLSIADCLYAADILKLNDEELDIICDIHNIANLSIKDTITALMITQDIKTIILTQGSQGSQWFTNDNVHIIPQDNNILLKDTVGAGDAYAAICAAGIIKNMDVEETARLATEFSAKICSIRGALPDNENIYKKFRLELEKL